MNLLLSNKIRLMDQRKFYYETADQPCWYVELQKAEKRRQYKWKIGVKYLGDKEEHLVGMTALDLDDQKIWDTVTSKQFATELLTAFKSGGIKAAKEWLKDG